MLDSIVLYVHPRHIHLHIHLMFSIPSPSISVLTSAAITSGRLDVHGLLGGHPRIQTAPVSRDVSRTDPRELITIS